MHKHHIIPKHEWMLRFGSLIGIDETDNIVHLTVEQHAEVHKNYWEHSGCIFDKIAWLTLSGQINNEEARRLSNILSQTGKPKSEEVKAKMRGRKFTDDHKRKLSLSHLGKSTGPFTDERKEKIRISKLGKQHSEETKEKLRQINLGKFQSEGKREKCRILGLGRVCSASTRLKISQSKIGKKLINGHFT